MVEKYKTNAFKKLLDRLQEESWQLELLISGFAIFGLFYAIGPIVKLQNQATFNGNGISSTFYAITIISISILIFNLLLHVVLRGLWIGSLGLRSVSGDIDYDKLNYTEKFTEYLREKVGSFDAYIEKLENLCSVIFAISFLLIFYVLALFSLGFIAFQFVEFTKTTNSEWINKGIELPLTIVFSISAFLVFFDFITQGLLKKSKRLNKIYFPIYRVFSLLTLSFLYRPLVYNFLDNKFGKRISMLLIPFYFIIALISSMHYQKSNYITTGSTAKSDNNIANARSYQDVFEKDDAIFIDAFAIQSKVIREPYIKIMVPLVNAIEEPLEEFNPSLKPDKDKRGYKSGIMIGWDSVSNAVNYDSIRKVYLNTFQEYYHFKIDSTSYKTEFVITKSDDELGFESYIGIRDLSEGKHIIEFQRRIHKETDSLKSILKVPFWYFKE